MHGGKPVIYFDNPAGTQLPREAIEGYATYLETQNANTGGHFSNSRETDRMIAEARSAMADFLGAPDPDGIIFGQNMTSLTFSLSRALERMLRPGDEIVVTRLEHDANIAPWLTLLDAGIDVRWIDLRPEDVTLDLADAERLVGARTRLVAVGYASNAFGTVNDVRHIADLAHAAGAWVFVDAVHYGPHGPIDVAEIGADLLALSPYKFFGPHLGVLWGRAEVLSTLRADHVRPSGDEPPGSWETGTLNHEALSALLGTLRYLESLSPGANGRRDALRSTMSAIRAYEQGFSRRLIDGLQTIPGLRIYGITDPDRLDRRVPTFSFRIDGHEPDEVASLLGERGIFTWAGDHYAVEPMGRLGLTGTQRIGLVHYNTPEEIDVFVETLDAIVKTRVPAR